MNKQWYLDLVRYCFAHRRDQLCNAIEAAARCKHVSDDEYSEILADVRQSYLSIRGDV